MSTDTEIANLEFRVVEAAVAWRRGSLPQKRPTRFTADYAKWLEERVDALIAAREEAERREPNGQY